MPQPLSGHPVTKSVLGMLPNVRLALVNGKRSTADFHPGLFLRPSLSNVEAWFRMMNAVSLKQIQISMLFASAEAKEHVDVAYIKLQRPVFILKSYVT